MNISTVAVIPAKKNSTRFPEKNLKELDGKPLVCHTIDKAIGLFDKIYFASESEDFINMIRERYDNRLSYYREIPREKGKVVDVVEKIFDTYELEQYYNQIWLLLPTCPLREREDIRKALRQFESIRGYDGIVSYTDYEFPPQLALTAKGTPAKLEGHGHKHWEKGNSRSQDHEQLYRPNGAMYGMWSKSFDKHRNFYGGKTAGYYMPRERSIDIDEPFDMFLAEQKVHFNKKNLEN